MIFRRPLEPGETLAVFVNGNGPLLIDGNDPEERARRGEQVIDVRRQHPGAFVFDREWWRRGEHDMKVNEDWWLLADNVIRLQYNGPAKGDRQPLNLVWIDLILNYSR